MASTVIGALSVEITADTKGIKDGLKATGDALKLSGKKLRENTNKWGKWALAATAAAATVTAAIVKSNLTSIRELNNVAMAAGTQVAAFERGAFAAKSFGVEQEKYGDILKDVNDRVGDFLISGAGPMVDFFEQIAPKVGITAEAFKGLSGQESLGLYVKSLEEAGVSQQEMTFFMEALAGDSIRLAPLFQNNAKAFKELTKEAKALGIGLSDIDVQKAEMASKEIDKALGLMDSMGQQLTVELAPIIGKIVDLFVDMAKESGGASEFIKDGIDGVVDVIGLFADGLRGVEVIFKIVEVAAIGFSALVANIFAGLVNIQANVVDSFTGGMNLIIEASNKFLGTDFGVIPKVRDSDFVKSINKVADNMTNLVSETTAELHDLMMQPLPSEEIKTFVDEAVAEYEKLAAAKVIALSNETLDEEGTGTKKKSTVEIYEAETIGLLDAMGIRFASTEEAEIENLAREKALLDQSLENNEITQVQFNERSAAIHRSSEDAKRQMTMAGIQAGFQALAANSKKVERAMKAAAIVQALIKGKQAAVDAFQAGMSVGGPFAPVVAAAYTAASIANTASLINNIRSSGSGSGGVSAPKPAKDITAAASGGENKGQSSGGGGNVNRQITVDFANDALLSPDQVRQLLGQISDQMDDGYQIITGG